jgi:hypothetical protein
MESENIVLRRAHIADAEWFGYEPTAPRENNDLLNCRLAMLGLDVHTLKHGDNETFELIKRRCTNCGLRETCAADLKRDLNNPLVGTYCPNAGALNALTEAKWLAPIIENYWRQHYPWN